MVILRPVSRSMSTWNARSWNRRYTPVWSSPSRARRSPTSTECSVSTVFCSSRPARTRCSTYSRLRFSSTTQSIPACCNRSASVSPAGPAPTIPTWVRIAGASYTLYVCRAVVRIAHSMADIVPLREAIAELVHDGDAIAMEGFTHLIPFAAGHEVLRQGRHDLELIRMTPDVLYDQLIGMGA